MKDTVQKLRTVLRIQGQMEPMACQTQLGVAV